jgi:hypothetical protein
MPEDQNVQADSWNKRLNQFLKTVMQWQQLGQSNEDVWCESLKRKVGIDSVFAYRRNPSSGQQVVLVEAKTAEKMENINRSKIQEWIDKFIVKLECAPLSPDFQEKFHPDTNAQYHVGLIGLWVRNEETYIHSELEKWLSQVQVPKRRVSLNICFASNESIGRLCAIYDELARLRGSAEYASLAYHVPTYGEKPPADGTSLPAEMLLSKIVFLRSMKRQRLKGSQETRLYTSHIVFYLGNINSYHDLRFIGLALKGLQFLQAPEIVVYTRYDPAVLRSPIEDFKHEWQDSNVEFHFRQLVVSNTLPGWLRI